MNRFYDNHFWYINSGENACTHVYKRGKKEGFMCQKNIKTNLEGQKADFLCCLHSKKHIPKKRVKKEKLFDKSISENKEVTKIKNTAVTKNKKDIKKIYKKKIFNKKIYLCNFGVIDLGKIIEKLL